MNYATARAEIGKRCNLDCQAFPELDGLVKSEVARCEVTCEELDIESLAALVRANVSERPAERELDAAAAELDALAEVDEQFDASEALASDTRALEAMARAAHEVNRAYCLANDDGSQPSWEDAPEWQKSSALNGVRGALRGNTPEESHASWYAEKLANGWAYGPVKDPVTKEHPCMVEYAELPPPQRAKDGLFVSTVRAMARAFLAQ